MANSSLSGNLGTQNRKIYFELCDDQQNRICGGITDDFFETERLILRNYTMDDVPAVHEYFSNEEVSRYEDFWPQTVEDVTEGLSEWKDMDNRMAVVLKETGELIGSVGYWDCDERNTASSRLLERLGFQLIETVDDAYKEDADGNPIMIKSRVYKLTA